MTLIATMYRSERSSACNAVVSSRWFPAMSRSASVLLCLVLRMTPQSHHPSLGRRGWMDGKRRGSALGRTTGPQSKVAFLTNDVERRLPQLSGSTVHNLKDSNNLKRQSENVMGPHARKQTPRLQRFAPRASLENFSESVSKFIRGHHAG